MKTTKYLFFLSLIGLLFFCNGYVWATSLTTLKGTKWYLERMTEQDSAISPKITSKLFKQGAQQISFANDGKYDARNLLGLDSLKGFFIETKHTLVLSNEAGNAYYWVFEVENKTTDSLTLQFVNYSAKSSVIRLTFKRMTKQIEEMVLSQNNIPKYADFKGNWEWNFDGKKVAIQLNQVGKEVLGTHCYGVDCQHNYSLSGTVEGDTATLQIKDRNTLEILGVGKLIRLADGTLSWKLSKNEKGSIVTVEKIQLNQIKGIKEDEKM
ncbi:hypothetical protein [Bernardetia sp.]|uniref:hypothetical protein n=1 Tax=Bernardetia sp. TaxID=1937974 RepID=UPI0025C38DE3|nr:hypothetical protein [Bernardetia sp.]